MSARDLNKNPTKQMVLGSIYLYEKKASLPEEDRLVFRRFEADKPHLLLTKRGEELSETQLINVAKKYSQYSRFCESIDNLDEIDAFDSGEYFLNDMLVIRADTPQAFRNLGMPNLPVGITEAHAWAIMQTKENVLGAMQISFGGHNIDKRVLYQLPKLLEHPVIVCDNPKNEKRCIAVLPALSHNKPLIVPIEPGAEVVTSIDLEYQNLVASIFTNRNVSKYFGTIVDLEQVCYIDSRQERRLARLMGEEIVFPSLDKLPRDREIKQLKCVSMKREVDFEMEDLYNDVSTGGKSLQSPTLVGLVADCNEAANQQGNTRTDDSRER